MAIDVGRAPATPTTKYDALVASQLAQAENRIRLLDLTAGLLGLVALALAYVVAMILFDSKLLLTQHVRQLSLYVFLIGSAVYLYFAVLRPLRLRVNPYYAARQVERQLPHAKNSIVNWVDLHQQPLPPAIRGALGQRAAKDLSRVDLDRAISGRRAAWMGGLAGLFALAFIAAFLLLGPAPFLSLLKRTFNPFEQVGVSTRTQLTILKPEGGNATVTVGRGIDFVVEVNGKVPDPKAPDAVKLLYRYDEGDPWLERPLIQEPSREWTASLSNIEVKNGFWYKITGGDAVTEEYRVSVRAAPAILDFLAAYHYRPYVSRADELSRERDLKALRGTEVLLHVTTNRTLRDGRLNFEGKAKFVQGEVDPKDPHILLVRFVLDEDGQYRLYFTSTENEAYIDPVSYTVTAIPDQPPVVELTKPGEDARLPADALLHLEGKASDDIGVRELVLRMRVIAGPKLREQPYRDGDKLRLADGGHPRQVEYKDFVELSRVRDEDGRPFALRAGTELEYWLEASDACDYPHPNVAESKHYRVLLTEPEKNEAKRQQEKQQADKDKKQHEQKQDQQLQRENQDRQQQRQEQEARNKEEQNKSKDGGQGNAGASGQPKEGEQGNTGEDKNNNGQSGENKDGQGGQNNSGENNEPSKEDQKIEDQIKKALQEKQAGEDTKGEGQPEKGDQGNNNGEGARQDKPEGGDASGAKSEGENKGVGQQNAKDAGEGKDKGQPQPGGDAAQGDAKADNTSASKGGDKSEPKGDKAGSQPGVGDAGEGKDKGKPSDGPSPRPQRGTQEPKSAAGGEAKPQGDRKDENKSEAKQGGAAPQGERSAEGEPKSDAEKKGDSSAKGENKPDAGDQKRNATAKDVQDLERALESKDRQQRDEAKRQLEQIEKNAADPEARAKAEEALKKKSQQDGAGDNGSSQSGNGPSGEPKGEPKKGEGNGSKGNGSKGDGSKGDGSKGDGSKDNRSKGDGSKGDGSKGDGSKGDGSQGSGQGSGSAENKGQGGNTPGGGGQRRGGEGDGAGQGDNQPSPNKPAKPRDHRAAQMQLEDFAKRVNKDILKKAGVSEEAWKKYLEARRKQLATPEPKHPDAPVDPQQARTLPSMGGRTIQSADGKADAHGPDRGQPPPGYRDSFREFTRQMSKKN
jgi:hypothetical protein